MKTYSDEFDNIFYRINTDGNAVILYAGDGELVTKLDENVYPVGSGLSVRYDHPEGVVLTVEDAEKIGIPHEDECR